MHRVWPNMQVWQRLMKHSYGKWTITNKVIHYKRKKDWKYHALWRENSLPLFEIYVIENWIQNHCKSIRQELIKCKSERSMSVTHTHTASTVWLLIPSIVPLLERTNTINWICQKNALSASHLVCSVPNDWTINRTNHIHFGYSTLVQKALKTFHFHRSGINTSIV